LEVGVDTVVDVVDVVGVGVGWREVVVVVTLSTKISKSRPKSLGSKLK
jgi:hypothetical protein